MRKFYANEIAKLGNLLQGLTGIMEKYNRRDTDVLPDLLQWLTGSIETYQQLGQLDKESQLLAMKTELVTAQRGINPLTFEKVSLRRHELQMTIAYKVMQAAEEQLRNDLATDQEKLKDAADLLSQIVIAGLQTGIIKKEEISKIKTQKKIKALWDTLAADANIFLGQTRALLLVSEYDIWVLMGDLLASLRK